MPTFTVLDGGMGTTVEDDYRQDIKNPLWGTSLLSSRPDIVKKVHQDFVNAGATLIETASYSVDLSQYKSRKDAEESASAAVRLASEACSDKAQVVLSLGLVGTAFGGEYTARYKPPYGPFGDTTHDLSPSDATYYDAVLKYHLDRLLLFANDDSWSHISTIAFETIPLLFEARAIREAMEKLKQQTGKTKPFWIAFVFVKGHSPHARIEPEANVTPYTLARAALEQIDTFSLQPFGLGVNCTKLRDLSAVVDGYAKAAKDCGRLADTTFVCYPDGGGSLYEPSTMTWHPDADSEALTPSVWADKVIDVGQQAKKAGFQKVILGGCCKAGPKYIEALSEAVRELGDI